MPHGGLPAGQHIEAAAIDTDVYLSGRPSQNDGGKKKKSWKNKKGA
jgi:hypothetical protein